MGGLDIPVILAIGVLAALISLITATCSSFTFQRESYSEPPQVLPLRLVTC